MAKEPKLERVETLPLPEKWIKKKNLPQKSCAQQSCNNWKLL
jgi:hypothetical protein